MRRILILSALLAVAAAAPAQAGTTLTLNSDVLVVIGDGGSNTWVVSSTPGSPDVVSVTGPAGFQAPPAGCTGTSTSVSCPDDVADEIDFDAGGGDDDITINEAAGEIEADAGVGNDKLRGGSDGLDTNETGGQGDDEFFGADAEEDTFVLEAGNDTYHGGTAPVPADLDPLGDPARYQNDHVADDLVLADGTDFDVSLDDAANDADGQGGTDSFGSDIERVYGQDGNDTLTAGPNPVDFYGAEGNDTLTGGPGRDALLGERGNDVLRGGGGDDTLWDGDVYTGYYMSPGQEVPGDDALDAGPGDDILRFSFGRDDVVGGDGTDTAQVGRGVATFIDPGNPSLIPSLAVEPLTITLDDQPNDGKTGADEGDNVHTDVENVDARFPEAAYEPTPAPQTITGSAAANRITTDRGDDVIDPGAGADVVSAGEGADQVATVDGATDVVDCGGGADRATADLPGQNPTRADALSACETVTGTDLPSPTTPIIPAPGPGRPKATLSGRTSLSAKAFLRSFKLRIGVVCDQACAVRGDVLATRARLSAVGDLTIGSGSLKVGSGKRTLVVKVAKKYRREVKRKLRTKRQRRKGIKLAVAVTVTNATGQASTRTRRITVKG